jgi:hypothetical protein
MATLFIVLDPAPLAGARLNADDLVELFRISRHVQVENNDSIYRAYPLLSSPFGRFPS